MRQLSLITCLCFFLTHIFLNPFCRPHSNISSKCHELCQRDGKKPVNFISLSSTFKVCFFLKIHNHPEVFPFITVYSGVRWKLLLKSLYSVAFHCPRPFPVLQTSCSSQNQHSRKNLKESKALHNGQGKILNFPPLSAASHRHFFHFRCTNYPFLFKQIACLGGIRFNFSHYWQH